MVVPSEGSGRAYKLWLEPEVHETRLRLPGKIRQRIKREIEHLSTAPRPPKSKSLDTSGLDLPSTIEVRRLRLEHWRVLYAINDVNQWVWILAIHQRPPYNYEDLPQIVSKILE